MMTYLHGVGWILVAGALCVSPSVSWAADMAPGSGFQAVEIVFETTAPYYQPDVAVASWGMPVRWWNPTASPHSIRHDGCVTDGPCAFWSIAVPPDNSFVIAPLPPGKYPYHCELHPVMRGTLIVTDSPVRSDGAVSVVESLR